MTLKKFYHEEQDKTKYSMKKGIKNLLKNKGK